MSANSIVPLVSVALVAAAGRSRTSALSSRSSEPERGSSRLRSWRNQLVSLWLRFLAWQTRRGMRKLLNTLDDRTLRDIGFSRSEVDAAVTEIELAMSDFPRPPRRQAK